MIRNFTAIAATMFMACGLLPAQEQGQALTVTRFYTDNAVIQRDAPFAVWGTANPGESVTVSFAAATIETKAGDDGKWQVTLPSQKANSVGETMVITAANETSSIRSENILVGDIWVASGQSNMAWGLVHIEAKEDIATADFPGIRFFVMKLEPAATPREDPVLYGSKGPYGLWYVTSPEAARNYSAVAYYFARRIHEKTGIPIGMVTSAWSGTRIGPWVPPEGLDLVPELAEVREEIKKQPAWKVGDGPNERWHALFYGMIAPITKIPIKGVIWYQGESNSFDGENYRFKMRALVEGWRKVWNIGSFPFYYVQLANFDQVHDDPKGGDGWAAVREGQRLSLAIPNTGMAVAIDVGEADDIHPKYKMDVGERLARWALHHDYGFKELVPGGPLFQRLEIRDGKAFVYFDYAQNGLMAGLKQGDSPVIEDSNATLQRFAIAGEDRKWYWADAEIQGNTVVLQHEKVPVPVAVRYAYSMNPAGANLYNRDGLPAVPFRTDDWD